MASEIITLALKSILRNAKDVEVFLAANPGKTDEQLLAAALALKNEKSVVRRKQKELVEKKQSQELRKKVALGSWDEMLFIARALVLCGLPYKRTKDREVIKTARLGNGDKLRVTFKASKSGVDLPFGKDRALLAWITTCAKKQGNARVKFESTAEFIRAFGLSDSGTHYKAFRDSLDRLKGFSCYIEVDNGEKEASHHESVIKDAVVPSRSDARRELSGEVRLLAEKDHSGYYLELDPSFYQELVDHSVPLPLDLMKKYGNNPIAWDFIQLISYRTAAAKTTSRIPLDTLVSMLGSSDSNIWRLRATLESILEELKEIWPEMNARFEGKRKNTLFVIGPPLNGHTLVPRKAKASIGITKMEALDPEVIDVDQEED
ncbi:MAG: Plasmid encoded RepA protein [Acidobacteria bacterium ADurb.Bin340]|nr:MAG: Plasmid encoded RepA protein [Acidobacteria bacterium ADurb.Bin340]